MTRAEDDPRRVLRTAHELLGRWLDLVAEVEDGCGWSAPELANDLGCRTRLAGLWRRLPEEVRAARPAELDALDERFRAATTPWPGHEEITGQWWTWRIPRVLEAEPGEPRTKEWPLGWDMLPFPRPDAVGVVE